MDPRDSPLRELDSNDGPDSIEYEYDDETPASLAVIHAICALAGVDPIDAPIELGFILHDHVDPSALDTILGDGTGSGAVVVSFEVIGGRGETYAVDISDDGRIEVRRS